MTVEKHVALPVSMTPYCHRPDPPRGARVEPYLDESERELEEASKWT